MRDFVRHVVVAVVITITLALFAYGFVSQLEEPERVQRFDWVPNK